MKLIRIITIIALGLFALGAIAQAPVVVEQFLQDSQLGPQVGLKVENKGSGRRVLMVDGGLWGIDGNNAVRFQLLTDGTLKLYNAAQQNTITLDGANGQILMRDSAGALRVAITSWDGRIEARE